MNQLKQKETVTSAKVMTVGYSLLRAECMLRYYKDREDDKQFMLYYLLVCCSDGGIIVDRSSVGKQIMLKMGISRACYDMLVFRLKKTGLLKVVRGYLVVDVGEGIDWDNQPDALLVKSA